VEKHLQISCAVFHLFFQTMKTQNHFLINGALAIVMTATFLTGCTTSHDAISNAEKIGSVQPSIAETKDIAGQAYIYGFPMIAAYKAMYQFNINQNSGQYKGAFNTIWNDAKVFTPKDTAIVTPNSDTPYSMVQADLRAEPIVLCVPEVEPGRYYSVQLCDMYSFNYGYIGSRATGNGAGCYLVAGPDWKGAMPAGIKKVFRSETQFGLIIYRTQLFGPDDMGNVKKIQSGYTVQTLSQYLHQPAPPAPPAIKWFKFTDEAFKTDFAGCLDFLLQFCPEVPQEMEWRAKFASIGIGPGRKFDFEDLDLEHKMEMGQGIKAAYAQIEKQRDEIGKSINGWRVGSAFGDRNFYNGNYLLRAGAALAGIYGNSAVEAMYPMTKSLADGELLDGSKHNYTLTFPAGQFPPVNAFWSVTMYDGKTQLLIENPINRYLINSPMLPGMKMNADGSLTIYIQKDSPGADKESNWLPAPDGPIYLVMRLYWPKAEAPSILPPGEGTWKPPGIVAAN
jgi:hypothetical protein